MADPLSAEEYLARLPADRRAMIEAVRGVILGHLPEGYVETVTPTMLTYDVPLETYPDTYNKKPLQYVALASQKQYASLYLMGLYAQPGLAEQFEREYRATGKRYHVGKSCVRFRTLDDLPLDLVGRTVGSIEVDAYVSLAEQAMRRRKR